MVIRIRLFPLVCRLMDAKPSFMVQNEPLSNHIVKQGTMLRLSKFSKNLFWLKFLKKPSNEYMSRKQWKVKLIFLKESIYPNLDQHQSIYSLRYQYQNCQISVYSINYSKQYLFFQRRRLRTNHQRCREHHIIRMSKPTQPSLSRVLHNLHNIYQLLSFMVQEPIDISPNQIQFFSNNYKDLSQLWKGTLLLQPPLLQSTLNASNMSQFWRLWWQYRGCISSMDIHQISNKLHNHRVI